MNGIARIQSAYACPCRQPVRTLGRRTGLGDDSDDQSLPPSASESTYTDQGNTDSGENAVTGGASGSLAPLQQSGGNNQGTENPAPISSASQGGQSLNAVAPSGGGSGGVTTTPSSTSSVTSALTGQGLTTEQMVLIVVGVAALGGGVWYMTKRHKSHKASRSR